MAVFGLPKRHEDDALRATRAAFEMKQKLEEVNERLEATWGVRLENRTGVNTGEVVAGDVSSGQRLVTGDTVNTAARLEQAAPALEILIGDPTYRLVKDAVTVEPIEPLELKGKEERVPAYKLLGVTLDDGVARRLDAPMVGRVDELHVLLEALERASTGLTPELVTVFGPAGAGKSRLLREFLARADSDVRSLRGRCLSYGDGITFWPLGEVVRSAASIADDDARDVAVEKLQALVVETDVAERVGAAIGLSDRTFSIDETFWAARRLLERIAASAPLVVLIDDIHWAEGTFLDLLRFIADSAEAPIVLVCSSRKDLLEEHADWGEDRVNMHAITLEPLSEAESALVLENLLGSSLDDEVRSKVITAAEGNPLFVEQMLSMLIDDGILHRDAKGRWIVLSDIGSITIPPSISALLTARLDRLGATERSVIERGAVMGQVFFRGALEELVPDGVRTSVPASLDGLARKELIRRDEATQFAAQEAYRFLHILIRDAAYQGLLKRTRAELHEAFVDWLEQVTSGREMEYEEIRGYHLEQTFLILTELAPLDDHGRAVGSRGARYLTSAGRRALARGDMPAAANLLQRAAALLPAGDADRPRLLLDAGEAFIELGEFTKADEILHTAAEEAATVDDPGLRVTAELVRLQLRYSTQGESQERIEEEVARAVPLLREAGDHQGLFRAWRLLTLVHWTAAHFADAEAATLQMIEEAELTGDAMIGKRFLGSLAISELYGPKPVPEAIRRCEELLEQAEGDRKAGALILTVLAHLEAMRGAFDRSRDLFHQARASFEELGWKVEAALISLVSGPAEMLADDPASAEVVLRRDFETLDKMGERNYISTIAGFLAEAIYRQGRLEEAQSFAELCERYAAADDVISQVLWRSVRAKVAAQRASTQEAERMIGEAVAMMEGTDWLDELGASQLDRAEILERSGKLEPAKTAAQQALDAFVRKGNIVSAERARATLVSLDRPMDPKPAIPS